MSDEFLFLTEKQKTAYTLRQTGLSYKAIGQAMNHITPSAARELVLNAQRGIRSYERHLKALEKNQDLLNFTLSRGEMKMVVCGLRMLRAHKTCRTLFWYDDLRLEDSKIDLLIERSIDALSEEVEGKK